MMENTMHSMNLLQRQLYAGEVVLLDDPLLETSFRFLEM
jgi:hypothetical protein